MESPKGLAMEGSSNVKKEKKKKRETHCQNTDKKFVTDMFPFFNFFLGADYSAEIYFVALELFVYLIFGPFKFECWPIYFQLLSLFAMLQCPFVH